MYSRVIPLEELRQFSEMYWLPPNGKRNGVLADTWVFVVDIEKDDVKGILDALTDADVGGYVATSHHPKAPAGSCHRLYVDRTRYNTALDVAMLFLRGDQPRPEGARTTPRSGEALSASRWHAIAAATKQSGMTKAVSRAIWVLIAAAFIGLALAFVYHAGASHFPVVHHTCTEPHTVPMMGPASYVDPSCH
jgi:hypothetical protein